MSTIAAPRKRFRVRWAEVTACVALSALAIGGTLYALETLAERAAPVTVTHSEAEWAYETCRYGASMFYVGRDILPLDAQALAVRDCNQALEDMGQTEFQTFYSPLKGN